MNKRKSFIGILILAIILVVAIATNIVVNASTESKYVLQVINNGKGKEKQNEEVKLSQTIIESESNDLEMVYELSLQNIIEKKVNTEVAFVIDTSYSMIDNSVISDVKKKSINFATGILSSIENKVNISVSNNSGVKTNLTNNQTYITNVINGLVNGQGSNLADGINYAKGSFSKNADTDRTVIIVTDSTDDVSAQLEDLKTNNINVIFVLVDMTNNVIGTPENSNFGQVYMFNDVQVNNIVNEIAKSIMNVKISNQLTPDILNYFDLQIISTDVDVENTEDGFTWNVDAINANINKTLKYKLVLKDNIAVDRNLAFKTWYSNNKVNVDYRYNSKLGNLQTVKEDSPTFTVCETFKIKIQAVSSQNENLAVKDVTFNIIGTDENGKEVYNKDLITDTYGYVTVPNQKTLNKVIYKITPTVNQIGYEYTSPTQIIVNNDYLGRRVIEVETDGLKYDVNDIERIVTLKMPINVQSYALDLNVTELDNSNVALSNIEFRLIQPKLNNKYEMDVLYGTTNEEGKLTFKPTVMTQAGTYDYILTQMNEQTGYTTIGNATLRLTFNNKGEITQSVILYNNNAKATLVSESNVRIDIGNESNLTDVFNFELNLADVDTKAPLNGANYNVTLTNSNGTVYTYGNNVTDENGKINLELPGTGYVTIKITENSPVPGYTIDTTKKEILIQRIDGQVKYVIAKTPDNLDVVASSGEDKVTVNLTSKLKEERNIVKVSVFDKDETPMYPVEGIEYELINKTNGRTYGPVTTNIDGTVEFTINDEVQGTYQYELNPLNIPHGYKAVGKIDFNMIFDNASHIAEANIVNGEVDICNVDVISNQASKLYTAYIETKIEIDASEAYYFEVDLKDIDNQEGISDARYDIEIIAGNFIRKVSQRPTDENGKISTRIPVDKNIVNEITVAVTEVAAKRGYKIDSIPQELTINLTNNSIIHTPQEVLPGDGRIPKYAEIVGLNRIVYHHTNRKKTASDTLLNLNISTVDKTSEAAIGGKSVNIKSVTPEDANSSGDALIKDPEGGELDLTQNTSTEIGKEGYLSFEGLVVTGAKIPGEQVYELDITIDGTLVKTKITFRYNEEKDIIQVINVEAIWGNRFIRSRNFSSAETQRGYESDINLEIYTNFDGVGNLSLDLVKKDMEQKEILSGALYDMVIERPDGTRLVKSKVPVTESIEFDGIYVPEGSVIYITEIQAPVGYDINDTVILKVASIDQYTGEITLEEDGNTYKIPRTKLQKEASAILPNGACQTAYILELYDVQKNVFEFKINVATQEDRGVEGFKFKLENNTGAQVVTGQTDRGGVVQAKIGGRYNEVRSPITYTITGVQAGKYYKDLATPINVVVYFKDDGTVDGARTLLGQTDPNYVVNGTQRGQWYIISTNRQTQTGEIITDIEVKLIVEEQDPLVVNIETIDKFTNQTITQNVEYSIQTEVEQAQGTTRLDVKYALTNATETYELVQKISIDKYIELSGLRLTVIYDKNGDIQGNVTSTNKNVVVVSGQGKELSLKVYVEPRVPLAITNIAKFDQNQALQGGEFTTIYKERVMKTQTDYQGKAIGFLGDFGATGKSETLRYKVLQTKAATGFACVEPFEIDVTFDENRNVTGATLVEPTNAEILVELAYKQPSTPNDYGYIGNGNGIITLKVLNYPEFVMNIENVDRQDNTKKLAGATYNVTSTIPTKAENVITGQDGKCIAHLDRTKFAEKVIYTIQEVSPSVGYQSLAINAQIEVEFNELGYVKSARVIKRDDVTSASTVAVAVNEDNFKIDVQIKSNLALKFDINKIDEETKDPVSKVDFEVTARINKDNLSNYTQEEIDALSIKTTELTSNQYFGQVLDRLKIDPEEVESIKKEIVVQKLIKELKENDKITDEEYEKVINGVNATDKINILINLGKITKSQSNSLIAQVTNYQVIEILISQNRTTEDRIQELYQLVTNLVRIDVDNITTNVQGNAISEIDKTLANKTIEYTIKETKKADGYDWLDEVIIIEITYDSTGKMVKDKVKVVSGNIDITNIDIDTFQINASIGNKPSEEVRIHLAVEDVYNADKKLETAEYSAFLTDTTQGTSYSPDPKYSISLASNGLSGSGMHGEDIGVMGQYKEAAGTRILRLVERQAPTTVFLGNKQFNAKYQSIEYQLLFNITFNDEGSITDVSLHSPGSESSSVGWIADDKYVEITHTRNTINVKVKYYPMLEIQMQTTDMYTGESLEGKYSITSYRTTVGAPTESEIIKSGYIGYGINNNSNLKGRKYGINYTTNDQITDIDQATGMAFGPIESEIGDTKERILYVTEGREPTSPVQYQKYKRWDSGQAGSDFSSGIIAEIKVKYNDIGEIISAEVFKLNSTNNIKDNYIFVNALITESKQEIQVEVKYAPITTVSMKAEDTVSKAGVSGVRFEPYQNNTEVSNNSYEYRIIKYYDTASNGQTSWTYWGASINKGKVIYKMNVSLIPNGYFQYNKDTYVEVEVVHDENGRIGAATVLSKNTFNEANVYIDESCYGTTQLKLTYKLERKLGVQINKKDKYDPNILLSSKFSMQSNIDTSILGNVKFEINSASKQAQEAGRVNAGKTVEYTLSEITVPDGYKPLSQNLKITVQYNENGTINSVYPADDFTRDNINVDYICTNARSVNKDIIKDIEISIINEPKFGLDIQLVDKFYNNIPIDNVTLEITNDKGDKAVGNLVTNDSGSLSTYIGPVYPNETVHYTIKQKTKANGYYQLTNDIKFSVTYDQTGKAVDIPILEDAYTNENSSLLTKNINSFRNTHTARMQIYNMPEDVKIGIKKYDELTNAPIGNVEFKVTVEENGTSYELDKIITNSNGEMVLKLDTFKETQNGRVVKYIIHEIEAPNTYRRMQDVTITVTYASDGSIKSWMEQSNASNIPYKVFVRGNTQITTVDSKYVHVKVDALNNNAYDLIVKDEDINYEGFGIKETQYDISINGIVKNPAVTNTNGKTALRNLTENGNIEIRIAERTIGEGFRENRFNDITLQLYKAAVGEYSLSLLPENMTQYNITEITSNNPNEKIYEVILDEQTSTKALVTVNEEYGTINVVLKNESKTQITLLKQDINTKKSLSGVEFKVTSKDLLTNVEKVITESTTTDTNGIMSFDIGVAPQNTKVEYKFTELSVPEPQDVYETLILPQTVTVTYDIYGRIVDMKINSTLRTKAFLTVEDNDNCRDIFVTIGNGTKVPQYEVKFVSEDNVTGSRINGTEFRFDILKEDGGTIAVGTDITKNLGIDGKFYEDSQLEGPHANRVRIIERGLILASEREHKLLDYQGKLKVRINQTGFANGYIPGTQRTQGEVELTTKFEADPNGSLDAILKVEINNTDGLDVTVDEASREITIKIKNESRVNLNINKISSVKEEVKDELGNVTYKDIPIQGASFKVTSEIVTASESIPTQLNLETRQTGPDGKVTESVGSPEVGKTVIYTIHENKMAGYKEVEDVLIYVVYDIKGYIKYYELLSNYTDAKITGDLIGTRDINVTIMNPPIIEDYKLIIEKHNIDDELYPDLIPGVEFNIKVEEEYGQIKEWDSITNFEGMIISDYFSGYGNIKITLTETRGLDGYRPDTTPKYIYLIRNKYTGKIEKVSSDLNIKIDETENIIYLKPVNEFADNTYTLLIDKIDQETKQNITNNPAEFRVSIEKEIQEGESEYREEITLKTNETGRALKINLKNPEAIGTYIYTIDEISVPTGYVKDPEEIKFKVTFESTINGSAYVSKVERISGRYASVFAIKSQTIGLKIGNMNENSILKENEYALQLRKVDADTNELIQAEGVFKIWLPDGTALYSESSTQSPGILDKFYYETDTDKKVDFNHLILPEEEGEYTFTIREVTAPEGYNKIENDMQFTITFAKNEDGKIVIVNSQTNDENLRSIGCCDDKVGFDILNSTGTPEDKEEIYLKSTVYRIGEIPEDYQEGDLTEYKQGDEYISTVLPYIKKYHETRTSFADFKKNIITNADSVIAIDGNGNEIQDTDLVGTNMTLKLQKGTQEITVTIVVTGDINGDATITAADISALTNYRLGKLELEGAYLKAADTNYDGQITAADKSKLTNVRLNILEDF